VSDEPRPAPLAGWRVIVTRPRAQSPELARLLADAGASALEVPVIEIADPSDGGAALKAALSRVGDYDWVVFSSANAVARCWAHLAGPNPLESVKLAAIGARTAAALTERGIEADLVPAAYFAESLVEDFPLPGAPAGRVLLPLAAGARDTLANGLAEKGWRVEVVEAYRTVRAAAGEADIEGLGDADAVMFASSSAVTGYLELAGPAAVPAVVACIGPVTAQTAERAGISVDVVATEHTAEGLLRALTTWAAAHAGQTRRQ
jgi:uroporphyrinogen-III synthase